MHGTYENSGSVGKVGRFSVNLRILQLHM